MKKYNLLVGYFLTFIVCISLFAGCTSGRINQSDDKNRSGRKSDSENRTVDNEQEPTTEQWAESTTTEQWSETTKTEQWAEPTNTEQWSEEKVDKEQSSEESVDEKVASEHIKKLYGTWYIWIPGSAQSLYDRDTGKYVTHEYIQGSDSGKISIKENGTYSMRHDLWGKDETVEGKWRLSSPDEINGENVQAIILIDGTGGIDWAVAPSTSGKIRLLYESEWDEKSSLWIFDSELYKN